MNLFKKLFGKSEKKKHNVGIDGLEFSLLSKKDFKNFQDLVHQNAGLSFEKQQNFNDLTGGLAWNINLSKGTLSFGNLDFFIEVIGSLSFNDYSWMWGWANSKSGIPENLLRSSLKLKAIGEKKKIEEFTKGHFKVEEGFEHKMGLVASGLLSADAYFCANYGQGAMVLTLKSNVIPRIDKNKLEKVLTTFPQVVSRVDLNHKNTFLNYLIDRDFRIKKIENRIKGLKNKKIIEADFDELDRLKKINAKI